MVITRRQILAFLWLAAMAGRKRANALDTPEALSLSSGQWDDIRHMATAFVEKETGGTTRPFEVPASDVLAKSSRKVFLHYFPPFPLSYANEPRGKDTYDNVYLRPEGEGGHYASVGGFIKERPLTVPIWPTPFWRQVNFAIELLRGRALGADGFTTDILRIPPDPAWEKLMTLYQTATAVAPDFHLVPMLDAAALRQVQIPSVVNALSLLAKEPSAHHLPDGRLLITAFAAENQSVTFWQSVLKELAASGIRSAFLPVLLSPIRNVGSFAPFSYGLSWWGMHDLNGIATDHQRVVEQQLSGPERLLMQPVIPQDVRPKAGTFSEAGNTRLLRATWEAAMRVPAEFVQVVTWNDYSEGTEVAPSSKTQFLYYDLTAYYCLWFKTGYPPKIVRDAIYYCHRREILSPAESADSASMRLVGGTPVSNEVEMLAFLTEPAELEIEQGGRRWRTYAMAGLASLYASAEPGRPRFRIIRNEKILIVLDSAWEIVNKQSPLDPLYVGGSSNRLPLD